MSNPIRSICVFCGSAPGASPAYTLAAEALGAGIARRGWTLVYGGANSGLMGTVADSALAAGGEVVGILPDAVAALERGHYALTRLIRVQTLSERKARMAELSDAFAVLPGGVGTLDELFEMMVLRQLGLARHPVGLVNTGGYYSHLISFLEGAEAAGFVHSSHLADLVVEPTPELLLDRFATLA